MKASILCTALCLFILGPVLAVAGNRVVLQEKAFVSGPVILLGDIASVEGAGGPELSCVPIIQAPSGSLGITLSQEFVAGRIGESHQVPVTMAGSPNVQVFEKFVEISASELEAIYRSGVLRCSPWKEAGTVVIEEVRTPAGFRVPEKDRRSIQAKFFPREDFLGFTSAVLTAGPGASAPSCRVRGKIRVMTEVPVARVRIVRGSVIGEDDLEMKRLDISAYPALAMHPEDCLGMLAKGSLRPGRPFPMTLVERPPLISRGDPVFIEARSGALKVRDRGVALRDGSLRECIPVKNTRSGRQILGTVIAASRIEVMF